MNFPQQYPSNSASQQAIHRQSTSYSQSNPPIIALAPTLDQLYDMKISKLEDVFARRIMVPRLIPTKEIRRPLVFKDYLLYELEYKQNENIEITKWRKGSALILAHHAKYYSKYCFKSSYFQKRLKQSISFRLSSLMKEGFSFVSSKMSPENSNRSVYNNSLKESLVEKMKTIINSSQFDYENSRDSYESFLSSDTKYERKFPKESKKMSDEDNARKNEEDFKLERMEDDSHLEIKDPDRHNNNDSVLEDDQLDKLLNELQNINSITDLVSIGRNFSTPIVPKMKDINIPLNVDYSSYYDNDYNTYLFNKFVKKDKKMKLREDIILSSNIITLAGPIPKTISPVDNQIIDIFKSQMQISDSSLFEYISPRYESDCVDVIRCLPDYHTQEYQNIVSNMSSPQQVLLRYQPDRSIIGRAPSYVYDFNNLMNSQQMISQVNKEQNSLPFTLIEDHIIEKSVEVFGRNWDLIANILDTNPLTSGFVRSAKKIEEEYNTIMTIKKKKFMNCRKLQIDGWGDYGLPPLLNIPPRIYINKHSNNEVSFQVLTNMAISKGHKRVKIEKRKSSKISKCQIYIIDKINNEYNEPPKQKRNLNEE